MRRTTDKESNCAMATTPPPPAHLAGCHHLLVTLLLRYRLRNQPGLTCKHMAVQVEGRQVAAWRQNPRRETTIRSVGPVLRQHRAQEGGAPVSEGCRGLSVTFLLIALL